MKHTKHLKRRNKKTIKNSHTRKKGGKCGCGAEGCPIAPFAINGGKMNTRRRRRQHRCVRGGQALPMPPPLVGAPWTAEPNTWPGYGAPTNHGNHFSQNMYIFNMCEKKIPRFTDMSTYSNAIIYPTNQ